MVVATKPLPGTEKRLMTRSTHPSPLATAAPQSFAQCLAYFLTPQVWKQAQQAVPRRRAWRWQTQPLLFVLLGMTWCAGDSLRSEERRVGKECRSRWWAEHLRKTINLDMCHV